jgi:exopolyphosphatase/guanosine-5'-triphosphate,3'-diphosphate pyrophosphatase
MADVTAKPQPRRKPVAIIDMGSNSIRLVVYDSELRTPVPIFNEKALCALGQGLDTRGKLNPDGVTMARAALARYVGLAKRMGCLRIDLLATAAMREAEDGPAFVREIEKKLDTKVTVLTGEEEAKLAALGVMCGHPDMTGLVADLGGGSLDLVEVDHGGYGDFASLPLGVLRMAEKAGEDRERALSFIDRKLAFVDWLGRAGGRPLYAVGGAWRSLARLCIAQTGYPLQVLDNFTMGRGEASQLLDLISRQSKRSLEKFGAVSRKRLASLPHAALLLARLIEIARPERVVFSVYGLREGQFFKNLPERVRKEDPLVSACRDLARRLGRFAEHSQEILDWIAPLFDEGATGHRLFQAATHLSDVFWSEHPDYRAEQAFYRVFRLPFMGLDHRDRAFLALALFSRYQGDPEAAQALLVRPMLDEPRRKRAEALGLALRLAQVLSGGVPGVLSDMKLAIEKGELTLTHPGHGIANPDAIGRPMERLARALGLKGYGIKG